MRRIAAALACLAAVPASAEGFAVRDLKTIAADANHALGGRYATKSEPKRLILNCSDCEGAPIIDMQLGRQTDGTEGRVRSGQTSIARLESICQSRSPDCRLTGLSVLPAVGWISSYALGATGGSTAIILRDGDMLTIRSIAADRDVAARNAETIARTIVPRIVGR